MHTSEVQQQISRKNSDKAGPEFSLLDWEVDPTTCSLTHADTGAKARLTPRAMEVLVYLVENSGEVISANDLLELFWSKSVRSDHAVHNVIAELRATLGDQASQPRYIKTYPKRGYALVAIPSERSINVRPVTFPQRLTQVLRSAPFLRTKSALAVLLLAVATTLALPLSAWLASPAVDEPGNQRRLLVMPFENINVNAQDIYLSEQLPGSLVSRLSLLPDAQIVVSNGKVSGPQLVDYILSGTIQQLENQHRVQVNLTNARNNVIMFSDQFDFSSDDIFSVQDEIVQNVATALSIFLDENLRNDMLDWGTSSAIAYNAFLKAESFSNHSNHADFRNALNCYLLAIEQDPDFMNAYLGLANTATKMALYSTADTNTEMQRLVNFALKELLRIDPESEAAVKTQILALRVEGNNQKLIEERLRHLILAGDAPDYALSHYATLLASAKLYAEAAQIFEFVNDDTPFDISPDATWSYRSKIEKPQNLLSIKKQELLEKPAHLSILGYLAQSYAFVGDDKQANFYLARQQELDEEGPFFLLSQVISSALFGHTYTAADRFEAANQSNPDFNFAYGVKAFILGNIDSGIQRWNALDAYQIRRLFSHIDRVEMFFPDAVLHDQRYQALLEQLGVGYSWQRHLMESVMHISETTGLIQLSDQSRLAYAARKPLLRNNLWEHSEVSYPAPAIASTEGFVRSRINSH